LVSSKNKKARRYAGFAMRFEHYSIESVCRVSGSKPCGERVQAFAICL